MLLVAPSTAVRPRRIAALAAALLIGAGSALTHAAPAHAEGTYVNLSCAPNAGIADAYGGWSPYISHPASGVSATDKCGYGGLHAEMYPNPGYSAPVASWTGWTYAPPADTSITGFSVTLGGWLDAWDGSNRGVIELRGERAGRLTGTFYDSTYNSSLWPDKIAIYRPGMQNDGWLSAGVWCDGNAGAAPCPGGFNTGWMSLFAPRVHLEDATPPEMRNISGPAHTDRTWKDHKSLAYAASDRGGGVFGFRLYVDGVKTVEHVIDSFSGHCNVIETQSGMWVFGYPKPCPGSVDDAELIDTTNIPDGEHTITAAVVDVSQREATLFSGPKLVANHPPVNSSTPAYLRPADAAAPIPGLALATNDGAWTGPSLTYARAWQQCDASGTGCVQIPGATAPEYVPTVADVGHRLRYAVTATNAAGSITAYTPFTGMVSQTSSAEAPTAKPVDGGTGAHAANGGSGAGAIDTIILPGLQTSNTNKAEHTFIGHVVGEPHGTPCPQDKASLVFQHVKGGRMKLGYGRASTAQVMLTCTNNGKAIADAKLEIATKTGTQPAVAADVTTDGAGHATLRLAKGASRGITVGYRMYADDPMARAVATLRVVVNGRVSLKASRKSLHNGQAVRLTGKLAGGLVPGRGVTLAVQWKDGRRWRPFAQIRTNRKGEFRYAYKFTRTGRKVAYRLRVQVMKGQVDYPFEAAASKPVRVTVAP